MHERIVRVTTVLLPAGDLTQRVATWQLISRRVWLSVAEVMHRGFSEAPDAPTENKDRPPPITVARTAPFLEQWLVGLPLGYTT
jgi:hypothetical protein